MPARDPVKQEESAAMDRLEAALDLDSPLGLVQRAARSAIASLAGAADVAALAWGHRDGQRRLPAWASHVGMRQPLRKWLVSATGRDAAYAVIVDVPRQADRHHASLFVQLQHGAQCRLRDAGLGTTAFKILGAFVEMADNAIEHSESPVPPFATFEIAPGWWEFSVTDLGCGIPNSLRTSHRYESLNDTAAVRAALTDGVSRFDDETRGMGYGVLIRALAEQECDIRLRTGGVAVRGHGVTLGATDLVYALTGARIGLHLRVAGRL